MITLHSEEHPMIHSDDPPTSTTSLQTNLETNHDLDRKSEEPNEMLKREGAHLSPSSAEAQALHGPVLTGRNLF
jgi:hypothetical protein